MSESRISELKNKVMKVQEDALQETKKLLDQTLAYNQWAMDTQKEYMKLENPDQEVVDIINSWYQ